MWCELDDQFWSNPKIVEAGNEGAGVFARLISDSAAHLTDGRIPETVALFVTGGDVDVLQRLVGLGLLEKQDDCNYLFPSHLRCNPSRDEAKATSEKRQSAGRKGAASRYGKSSGNGFRSPFREAQRCSLLYARTYAAVTGSRQRGREPRIAARVG
jgi:hypothetical protein